MACMTVRCTAAARVLAALARQLIAIMMRHKKIMANVSAGAIPLTPGHVRPPTTRIVCRVKAFAYLAAGKVFAIFAGEG